jgi:hypothetical protein
MSGLSELLIPMNESVIGIGDGSAAEKPGRGKACLS